MKSIHNAEGEKLDIACHEGTREDCLVILGHGVTGNKDRPLLVALADALSADGWPCLRLSFAGNGDSEGDFGESHISKEVADLGAVLDQVGHQKRIAYIGHSMGGAVGALTAARDERIRVLVSLAGMVHTREFAEREFGEVVPGQGVMWEEQDFPLSQGYMDDLFFIGNTLDAARELRMPWLLLHGLEDDVVPPVDSRDLKAVLRGPVDLVELAGAGHSFEGYEQEVAGHVMSWLGKHL